MTIKGMLVLTDEQIAKLVYELINKDVVKGGLYELLCRQAYVLLESRLGGTSKGMLRDEAHSLAIEMILHIRNKRLANLQCAAHLDREMRKYLTRRESPAHHEVWTALSRALLALESDGVAARLSAASGANSQNAEWCLKGKEGMPPIPLENFFDEAGRLPVYHPSRKDGRLISPLQARELALQMLKLANGPILMQALHSEAIKHVVQTMAYAESLDGGMIEGEEATADVSRVLADRMPMLGYILEEEAVTRAGKLWNELEKSGDGRVLCLYYLPKHLLGRPVTGGELGDPRRVSEAGKRIRNAFQQALDLAPTLAERQESAAAARRDPSGGDLPGAQARLLGRIAEILMQFCSENSWDKHLNPEEGEP
jgi:hypothetical protein